jgi:hypothetical protein
LKAAMASRADKKTTLLDLEFKPRQQIDDGFVVPDKPLQSDRMQGVQIFWKSRI